METYLDLILVNANVILPDPISGQLQSKPLNVGITGNKITYLGSSVPPHKNIMDLKGLHILPGIIDSQVHFREPGLTHKEDLESGTRGALLGGITCVFEMPNTSPATTTKEAFEVKLNLARQRCHTHYAFYIGACPENTSLLSNLETLPHCSGVKVFMGSSTGTLLIENDDLLDQVLQNGRRRVAVHAEDEPRLKARRQIALDGGHPRFHPVWRDVDTALLATRRLLSSARKWNRKVHVLHVTTAEEMALLSQNKDIASVEVLPQHLTFTAPDVYERLGTLAQMNPPIREKRHQDALWAAINNGTVDIMGSDHAPHTREEKQNPYPASPSGFPGVQTFVPVMLNHVNDGRLSLERFVQLVCEAPRRLFGLKDRGRIALDMVADLTIVDLNKSKTVEESWIASKVGWSPYSGMNLKGWPVMSFLNGKLAMSDHSIVLPHAGEAVEFDKM